MEINKITKVGNQNYYSTKKTLRTESGQENDTVQISESAKKKIYEVQLRSEAKKIAADIVASPTSPSRQHKINEIKEKLGSGFYDNLSMEVLNKTADEIINSFFNTQK